MSAEVCEILSDHLIASSELCGHLISVAAFGLQVCVCVYVCLSVCLCVSKCVCVCVCVCETEINVERMKLVCGRLHALHARACVDVCGCVCFFACACAYACGCASACVYV